jgi:endoglucanase
MMVNRSLQFIPLVLRFGLGVGLAGMLAIQGCAGAAGGDGDGDGDGGGEGNGGGRAGDGADGNGGAGKGAFQVDARTGRIVHNGTEIQVRAASWFGLEGQDDLAQPGRMELYIGSPRWANAGQTRTIEQTMQQIKDEVGLNTVRLPIAPQCLVPDHPDGVAAVSNNAPEFAQPDCLTALKDFLQKADAHDLFVIIDIHSCSNHIGWRAGRLDDSPPYVDSDRPNYDYGKDNYTCRDGEDAYGRDQWLQDLQTIAALPGELGVDNVLGIDIFNEPHQYSWAEWSELAEAAYDAIAAVNDDLLVIVEGVAGTYGDQVPEPHGDPALTPNWGENLYGVQSKAPQIPRERLCFSPHAYGPSVFVKPHFLDQSKADCKGLEGDAAGEAGCGLLLDPAVLRTSWEEHFGYLKDDGYCVIVGEFGGYKDWPVNPLEPAEAEIWSHLPAQARYDWQWQNQFADYLVAECITDFSYWSVNPESADTGGLFEHAYDAASDSGQAIWKGLDQEKVQLLRRITPDASSPNCPK